MPRRILPSALLFAVVVVGCVGDDPTPPTDTPSTPDGGSDAGTPPASDDGSDASTSTEGGSSSGGQRSLTCNGTSTCTGTDECCGIGNDWIGASCKADCGGAYSLSCDDAGDCTDGQVCCYVTDGGARAVASYCAAKCDVSKKEKQLCAVGGSDECVEGSCLPLTEFSPNGLGACK